MPKELNEAVKRSTVRLSSDHLRLVIQAIVQSIPPAHIVRVAQAIVRFAMHTTGNLKDVKKAFLDVLTVTFSLDTSDAVAVAMIHVMEAIDADIDVGKYTAAAAVTKRHAHKLMDEYAERKSTWGR